MTLLPPSRRSSARKSVEERVTLISLITLLLVVFAVLFTLLHNTLGAVAAAASASPAQTAAAVAATPAPSRTAAPGQIPATNAGLLVTFLDVGQGDCTFLRSPSGKTMLVDGGPDGSFPVIDKYLTSLGVVGLDVVMASHVHADHIGGLISVVDTYPIGDFYYPPFDAESETYF